MHSFRWRRKHTEEVLTFLIMSGIYMFFLRSSLFEESIEISETKNSVALRKSVNYTTDWVFKPDGATALFIDNFVTKRCPLCYYLPSNWSGDSTWRDAIITFCFKLHTSLTPFVRMIRSVKCKAKIYILADEEAYKSMQEYIFSYYFRDCNVFVINCGEFKGDIAKRWSLYQMKTFVYRDFLHSYYHMFDRVLFCDMSDTVFQSDPFKDFMHEDAVFNYFENISIFEETETYDDLYQKMKSNIPQDSFIVTPACYFGRPVQVLKLIDLIQSYFFTENGTNTELVDQSVCTVIYYNDIYKVHNINMKVVDWNKGVLSANLNEFSSYSIGNITCVGCENPIPFLVHHSNYIPEITEDIYQKCPRLKGQKPYKYLANLPDDTRKKIDNENAEKIRVQKYIIKLAKIERRLKREMEKKGEKELKFN